MLRCGVLRPPLGAYSDFAERLSSRPPASVHVEPVVGGSSGAFLSRIFRVLVLILCEIFAVRLLSCPPASVHVETVVGGSSDFCGTASSSPPALRRCLQDRGRHLIRILRNGSRQVFVASGPTAPSLRYLFFPTTTVPALTLALSPRRLDSLADFNSAFLSVAPSRSHQDSRRDARIKSTRAADLAAHFFFSLRLRPTPA
ncbi:hypothetical protein HMN09_01318800 [Mycena chlorophos]|uniref:Uncharacterized protein n=1 Tax=Mycena chlorophos TaxID=658473 RepID=A0A8H6RZJ4_MYCCL|nr:hypothetical protein HMN09_01318800 [Mycena chlorophos]